MAVKRVRFTFPENLIREPIIYRLGHEFRVITNVRMADVDEKTGWVVLELEGEPDEIERSLAWAQERGVRVDPVTGDIVEGQPASKAPHPLQPATETCTCKEG